jgi:hypothetical protein
MKLKLKERSQWYLNLKPCSVICLEEVRKITRNFNFNFINMTVKHNNNLLNLIKRCLYVSSFGLHVSVNYMAIIRSIRDKIYDMLQSLSWNAMGRIAPFFWQAFGKCFTFRPLSERKTSSTEKSVCCLVIRSASAAWKADNSWKQEFESTPYVPLLC